MGHGSRGVLVPYKITLLSNALREIVRGVTVLVPYKITLLSNGHSKSSEGGEVLVPYKITLLSNKWGELTDAKKF